MQKTRYQCGMWFLKQPTRITNYSTYIKCNTMSSTAHRVYHYYLYIIDIYTFKLCKNFCYKLLKKCTMASQHEHCTEQNLNIYNKVVIKLKNNNVLIWTNSWRLCWCFGIAVITSNLYIFMITSVADRRQAVVGWDNDP